MAAVPSATSAGVLCSHANESVSGTHPARAARPATSNGMNTRKPVAAASPMPSATLKSRSNESFTAGSIRLECRPRKRHETGMSGHEFEGLDFKFLERLKQRHVF